MRILMSLPGFCLHCNEDYSYKQEGLGVDGMKVKLKCKCESETILLRIPTKKRNDLYACC